MPDISVIVCTHNPRPDYLRRTLDALARQTLPSDRWELLVVDNASDPPLARSVDLSWHSGARHVREDQIGLTPARLRGIAESSAGLLVFVDDDNILAADYLERAATIHASYGFLGTFGAGVIEPEFEAEPPAELRPRLSLLALRTIPTIRWSNNAADAGSIPWGAGLCVSRPIADRYRQVVARLEMTAVLDRTAERLFSGGDDLFSWTAASVERGFGIFPELRVLHLISAARLNRRYFLRLVHDHAFSSAVLHYLLARVEPERLQWVGYVHLLLHGARNGYFSMMCQRAASRGADRAARYVAARHLQPVNLAFPLEEAP
jgi:glycosyltransferase involved in cell wall biosynthesis